MLARVCMSVPCAIFSDGIVLVVRGGIGFGGSVLDAVVFGAIRLGGTALGANVFGAIELGGTALGANVLGEIRLTAVVTSCARPESLCNMRAASAWS